MALDLGAVKSRLQRARAALEGDARRLRAARGEKIMNDTELDEILESVEGGRPCRPPCAKTCAPPLWRLWSSQPCSPARPQRRSGSRLSAGRSKSTAGRGRSWSGALAIRRRPRRCRRRRRPSTSLTPWIPNLCGTATTEPRPSKCTVRRTPAERSRELWSHGPCRIDPLATALGTNPGCHTSRLAAPHLTLRPSPPADLEKIKKTRQSNGYGFIIGLCRLDMPDAQSLLLSKAGHRDGGDVRGR